MASSGTLDERTEDGRPALRRVMGPGLLLLFIVGDILGTGIYALTGQVAAEVGGVVWLPFLVAFAVMSSGITSASTAARAFAANFASVVGLDWVKASASRSSRSASWAWSRWSTTVASARASRRTWCSPTSSSPAC